MDNKIFMSRYEPGEDESKFEIVFDEDGARLRTTENDIVLHCESEEQSKEIIDMLTHLQTKDTQFVRVIITERNGRKHTAYYYKPQNIVCTNYITAELLEEMGCKIEEVEHDS